jgi:hypothetical protein
MTRPPASSRWPAIAAALVFVPAALAQEAGQQPPAPAPAARPAVDLQTVASEQSRADREASAAQERINQVDDETQKLLVQYRTALGEKASIQAYSDQLEVQIQSQLEDIDSIQKQLSEVETTAREVVPLTQRMLDTLAEFVELDVPFLLEERKKRIATLEGVMNRADVTISEKYRRVVEAYQIEMEYGRTLEAYEGRLGEGADARTVQFLRVGRVALLYQTLDGRETGYWDADRRGWVVDNDYRQHFKRAVGVATKLTAPDLVVVPVHAPKETAS